MAYCGTLYTTVGSSKGGPAWRPEPCALRGRETQFGAVVRYVAEELERHVAASAVTRKNDVERQDGEVEDKVRARGKSILKSGWESSACICRELILRAKYMANRCMLESD